MEHSCLPLILRPRHFPSVTQSPPRYCGHPPIKAFVTRNSVLTFRFKNLPPHQVVLSNPSLVSHKATPVPPFPSTDMRSSPHAQFSPLWSCHTRSRFPLHNSPFLPNSATPSSRVTGHSEFILIPR